MIAQMQRWVVALLASLATGWLAFFVSLEQTLLAVVGALMILNVQPLLIAVEFLVLMPIANRGRDVPPAGLGQRLRAWAVESCTAHAVFSWRQPFRAHAEPDAVEGGHPGSRPLVLVHGFFCNRAIWNPWMRRLRAAGVPHVAVTLEPVYGSIDTYVPAVDAAIERARRATGQAPVVVAHSMGGLAIRAWWRAHGAAADDRVARVITIGTPHGGTMTAWFAKGENAAQMRTSSAWLRQLACDEPMARRARFTCFWSHCDNIAMPATTATLEGADNRHVHGTPHVALAYADAVVTEALRLTRAV